MDFSNKTVLVTGGGSGIGLGFVRQFVEKGNTVVICGRDETKLKAVKAQFPQIATFVCDVGQTDERIALAERVTRKFPKLDILVNNAGIQRRGFKIDTPQPWESVSEEIKINLEAPIHLAMLFVPHLKKQANPAIINITSGLAFAPLVNAPIYSATKAAFHSFTLSLRHMLKDTPIAVLEVIPPVVNTDLGGKGLHTSGVDVDEFTDAIVTQFEAGQVEAAYGFAVKSSQASRAELDELFKRINQRH